MKGQSMLSMRNVSANKRTDNDVWYKSIKWFCAVGWALIVCAMVLADKAKPQSPTVASRFAGVYVRPTWDDQLVGYLCFILFCGVLISAVGLVINSRRMNRQHDRWRFNLLIVWIVSAWGCLYCLFAI
ncbi:MAG: hypothetical protein GY868_07850 [Deltaproteobacteria bacterium]|nr:hypothetical protein [Deltaproteobacteria bacterium]